MKKRVIVLVAVATSLAMLGLIPVGLVSAEPRRAGASSDERKLDALGAPARSSDWVAPAGKQLLQARRATARYRDIGKALDKGYENIDVFVPGQGCHYLNTDLLDATFDRKRPELLAYAEAPGQEPLLLGVEYAVPISESPQGPPEGFEGGFDVWTRNETVQLWTLHTWIYLPSPDGVFEAANPLGPQASQGCGTVGGGA